jgi:hypothetical protein
MRSSVACRRWAVGLVLCALLPITACSTKSSGTTVTPAAAAPSPAPGSLASSTVSPGVTQFSAPDQGAVMWGMSQSKAAPQQAAATYPVAVAPNGRYLVDDAGQPWRVQADAAWLMSSEATPEQVDDYLTTRRAQGFNSFYLMAMVHPGGYKDYAPNAPNDLAGDPPFATPNDFSTAGGSPESERYWQWIDSIVAKAADHGMVVMLAYTYLGFRGGDQGWYAEVLEQRDRQTLFDWGKWIGTRYRDAKNLIWFGLGDFAPPEGSEGAARARAMADGIKAAGAQQLFMAEPTGGDGIPSRAPDFGPIVDMNSFYGYGPGDKGAVYQTANDAYRIHPALPAWMEEGTYENENNTGTFSGQPWDTRRGRFWSVLGGGTAGDGFGSSEVWQWRNIPASWHTPGADYSRFAFDLFAAMPWWTLRPSGTDAGFAGFDLVPSGGGTYGKTDFITSALTEDRHWLLAYVPVTHDGARTFSVDTDALDGPVRARWFDPATGTYLAIGDGQAHPMAGAQSFTTPGARGDGTDDWVLVLDTEPDPCGTISSTGLYTAPSTPTPAGVVCEVTATRQSDLAVVSRSGNVASGSVAGG